MKVGDRVRFSHHKIRWWCMAGALDDRNTPQLKAARAIVVAVHGGWVSVTWDDRKLGYNVIWGEQDLTVVE